MNQNLNFEKVLLKYSFQESIPENVISKMEQSKQENLREILTKKGSYSILLGITVSLFLWAKRAGIGITFTKSVVAVTSAAAIGTAVITTTTAYTVKQIISNDVKIEKEKIDNNKTETSSRKNAAPTVPAYSVAIMAVEVLGLPPKTSAEYTSFLLEELKKLNGHNTAILMNREPRGKKAPKLMTTTIVKIEDGFRISCKVINRKDSKVLLLKSEYAQSQKEVFSKLFTLVLKTAPILR